jgi:hypothetical protein
MRVLLRWLLVGFLLLSPNAAFGLSQSIQLFPTETEAQKHCPVDIVVWVNTPTGIYHLKGMRWYGKTKNGAYICQKDGDAAGYRATLNGQ